MISDRPRPLPTLAAAALAAAIAAAGCLGSGSRRVDAPCREMRGSVAREMLRDAREIPVLDVRSSWPRKLSGAVMIPLPELPGRVAELSRYRAMPVVVVGDDAEAGRRACEILAGEGFKRVIWVPEGVDGLLAGVRGAADAGPGPGDRR